MTAVMQNAMTVDVEDYFHVAALSSAIRREDWSKMEYRAEANTRRLLELFRDKNTSATFFVLGWVAERSPGLIKEIAAAGHEIACHGWSHQLVYRQSPEEFREETARAKDTLENLIGRPVLGYRAATYSITARSLWALDIIHELGFQYDSSIFPIRHDLYGIPDAPREPSVLTTPAGKRIVEFPMSTVHVCGVRLPVSGGGYFRLLPLWLTLAGLRKLNRQLLRPFVFYLHPWEIDPGQPVIEAGWLSRFRHYTNLDQTHGRLAALLDEFKFTTARNVLVDKGLLPA